MAAENTYLAGDVPGLLHHVRGIHQPYGDHGRCVMDGERWPCDTTLLADALEAEHARAGRLVAALRAEHTKRIRPKAIGGSYCEGCTREWPCPTICILDADAALAGDAPGRGEG